MTIKVDKSRIAEFLGNIWAFERLDDEQLRILADLVHTRNLAEDQVVWLQGQEVTYFTIVYSGRLRSVRRTASGSEKLVTKLTAGYHFGLAEMITQATSVVTLIADMPSVILRMDGNLLRTRLLNHADICYRLMQTMSRAIFGLTQELERASFENVHTRLARLLLKKRPSGAGLPIAPVTQNKVSHQELAVQIGASRETVSRALADFKRKGIIETSYRNITVRDRDGLMEYIGEYDQW